MSNGTVDVGMRLILLLAAQTMFAGDFSIGDFALFASYLWPMTMLMRMTGWMLSLKLGVGGCLLLSYSLLQPKVNQSLGTDSSLASNGLQLLQEFCNTFGTKAAPW